MIGLHNTDTNDLLLFSERLAEMVRILQEEQALLARQGEHTDQQLVDIEIFFKRVNLQLKALAVNKKNADAIIEFCLYWLTLDMLIGFIVLPASIAFFTTSLAILYFSSEIYTRCDKEYQSLLQKVAVLLTAPQCIKLLHGQDIDLKMTRLTMKLEKLSQALCEMPENENLGLQMKRLIQQLRTQERQKVTYLLILFLVFSLMTLLLQAYFIPSMIAMVMYIAPLILLVAVHIFNQFQRETIKKLAVDILTKKAEFEVICEERAVLDEKIEAHQSAAADYLEAVDTLNRLESNLSEKSIFKPDYRQAPSRPSGLKSSASLFRV